VKVAISACKVAGNIRTAKVDFCRVITAAIGGAGTASADASACSSEGSGWMVKDSAGGGEMIDGIVEEILKLDA
jgi:hypothetical protein